MLSRKGQGPNSLKVNRKGPKPTSGQALGLMKQRKEKLSPDLKGKITGNPKRKVELGYLRIPRGLGSLGYATGPS